MTAMKNNWEKDIHDRLGSFEQDAPDGLWADISKKMAEGNKGRSARIYKLYRMASAVAAACVVLILGYSFYMNSDKDKNSQMPQPGASMAKNDDRKPSTTKDDKTSIIAETLQTYHSKTEKTEVCRECTNLSDNSLATADTVEIDESNDSNDSLKHDVRQNESTPLRNGIEHHRHNNNLLLVHDVETKRNIAGNTCGHWSVSTSAMGAVGWEKSSKYMGIPVVAVGPDDVEWQDNPMLGIDLFNQDKEVKTEYKHHLPVRVGVKVGYAVSERLSIESGLTYTHLKSDINSGSEDNYFNGEQKLNYVGIPIGTRYMALTVRRFSLYGSANALLEKCVSGKVTSNYVINKAVNKTETRTIDSKPLQFSVGASVGVQVDILDNVGIYAEPGLSYYFNDRSSLHTIYKEKPLNFNFSVGIRYTINK